VDQSTTVCSNAAIRAGSLNDYCTAISDDVNYSAPCVKRTLKYQNAVNHITEWRMFKLLDTPPVTAVGLVNFPAWFLRIGAPFFSAPIGDMMMMNLSLSS